MVTHESNMSFKNYFLYIVIIIIFISLFVYLTSNNNFSNVQITKQIIKPRINQTKTIQTRANAFILTSDCHSARFNFTKQNIHRVFPNFFTVYCFKPIALDDPRIDKSLSLLNKKLASNLISFVTLWTYEIPKYSTNNDLEWSFVFEDDVDFIEPSKVSLPNYINAIQELMHHPEIQLEHGAFYLGICGPTFVNDDQKLIIPFSKNSLLSRQGRGRCTHGMGFTTKHARTFWTDISLYLPIPSGPTDVYVDNYCAKSGNHYYILGSNLEWPPRTGHYGIAYQDRKRFRSEVW